MLKEQKKKNTVKNVVLRNVMKIVWLFGVMKFSLMIVLTGLCMNVTEKCSLITVEMKLKKWTTVALHKSLLDTLLTVWPKVMTKL